MWVYVPSSALPLFVREAEDSTSESRELWPDWADRIALSCTWRGKHTPPQSWRRAAKRATWLRLLSGLTLAPSTADACAERWISSSRESRAKGTESPASDAESMTSGGCGQSFATCSSTPDGQPCSSKTCAASSASTAAPLSRPSSGTWPTLGTMRNGVCSARPTSERRTDGNASSSWPTPSARDGDPRRGMPATDADRTMMREAARGSMTASRLPSDDLKLAAAMWPTSSATSYGTNQGGAAGRSGKVRPSLETMAPLWATPTVRDWKDGACADANVPTNGLLGRQAARHGLQVPTTSTDGATTSTAIPATRRRLNPLFVEALMGWPEGWSAPTACDSSAMVSSPRRPSAHSSNSPGGSSDER